MRKTAGFLKFVCTVSLVFEVLVGIILAICFIALLLAGSFSELAAKAGDAITISGGTMTPAEMDALKPVIMIALGSSLVAVVLAILGTVKTKSALSEVKDERPFSDKCVESIKSAARIEVIGGIFGIVGALVFSVMASKLTVNGTPVGTTSASLNLTFIIQAVQKYMYFHVAKYGQSLENR